MSSGSVSVEERRGLLDAIAVEERRLAAITNEEASVRGLLADLRTRLARIEAESALPSPLPVLQATEVPKSPAEKVRLFSSLFRGRPDVYATRFVAKTTGKAGYAPACANKFVPGVCGLPKIKCADCGNQAFQPADDAAVLAHLRGKHVMGVYAMLADETCWFLAADFDEHDWVEDVRAFIVTARRLGLPVAVERSRSGNGAHVWFFFSAPIAASLARRLGFHLITETMSERHELGMGSYDRLFPSQDTLPRGGFGNLIALPLQHGPRQKGNSVFLDDELVALPDDRQWEYLASVQRIAPSTVERIVAAATRCGTLVGVPLAEDVDEGASLPWMRRPSRESPAPTIAGPLPDRVTAVLAQRLFVAKDGLSSPLLNRIKRLAAFQNPEFFKKQAMRLSTALTPHVIHCAEDLPQHISLPRGCAPELETLLRANGVALELEDQRTEGAPIEVSFQGALDEAQEKAARGMLAHDMGVLVAPPGVGKTVIAISLIASRARSTLVLVHRAPLLEQWRAQLSIFLGIPVNEIGQIGSGKRGPTGRIDVAMMQSLVRKDGVADIVAQYGHVVVDECHHLPAVSFERVLSEVKARYVVGLTATPQRRDGHHPITRMQLGAVRATIDGAAVADRLRFRQHLIVRETGFRLRGEGVGVSIQAIYAALAQDMARNQLIERDVLAALEEGRSPLLLTERKEHLEHLAARLRTAAPHLIVLQGGMGARQLRVARERIAAIPANEPRLVLATGRFIGEGFDDARLDTLFLAMPVSWKGTLVQYAGRLHRRDAGKTDVRIVDYVDREVPVLARMFEKRQRGYRVIGYVRESL